MKIIEEKQSIRKAVQEHYASRALSSQTCCGPSESTDSSCCSEIQSGEIPLMDELPEDITDFNLGCGDAVSLAKLQPGETVLDLGSGGGLECFLAARQVGPEGAVIGVDMTPEMLQRARQAGERLGLKNVEFREGYIEDQPVEDSSVDVVISNCVINLSPDKRAVMNEMYRVLKPGGRVAVSDIVTHGTVPEIFKKNMELWSACASGALPVSEWESGLKEAGFVDVRVESNGKDHSWLEKIPIGVPFSASITARKAGHA